MTEQKGAQRRWRRTTRTAWPFFQQTSRWMQGIDAHQAATFMRYKRAKYESMVRAVATLRQSQQQQQQPDRDGVVIDQGDNDDEKRDTESSRDDEEEETKDKDPNPQEMPLSLEEEFLLLEEELRRSFVDSEMNFIIFEQVQLLVEQE